MLLLVQSKFATYSKIHFTQLQQHDENHCIYLAIIGRRREKSRWKHDHACIAQNYLFFA